MCLSKSITLAIFGGSCTGKTTFVRYFVRKHDHRYRHCGEEIRRAAEFERVPLSQLSKETHVRVDQETVGWAKTEKNPKVLEGRYLNYVLAGNTTDLVLVQFLTNTEARSKRLRIDDTTKGALLAISRADSFDRKFCEQLYGGVAPLVPDLRIDTSSLSMEEIENQLRGVLK